MSKWFLCSEDPGLNQGIFTRILVSKVADFDSEDFWEDPELGALVRVSTIYYRLCNLGLSWSEILRNMTYNKKIPTCKKIVL